ncbi:MAG: hypothetical protein ACKPKO_00990, partial [Candidatus Fonsibacter sp.]
IDKALMALKENRLVQIHERTTQHTELTIEDEYNTDNLCGYIEEHNRIMIRAEYDGCGKSYTCKTMETRGHKVLFDHWSCRRSSSRSRCIPLFS